MPNVFEPEWEVELPEPWNLPEVAEHLDSGKVLVMHGPSFAEGVLEAYRRGDAVEQMADEPGG